MDARRGMLYWESEPRLEGKLNKLHQQEQAELATLLTPQELEGLHLRTSPAAGYVLQYLPEAQSEAEFAKMVQAVEELGIEAPKADPFASQYGLTASPLQLDVSGPGNPEAERQAQLRARLKDLLGEQRLTGFERQQGQ